jgi:repressor LexA
MSKTNAPSPDLEAMPWGLRVRELRKAADLTQDALAERIGTTKATISKIERSTTPPKLEWITKLASALNADMSDLVTGLKGSAAPSYIPVIGMIAAGNWREAIQSPDGHIPVLHAKNHMFALKVDGDSIDRVAPDGAFVAIDPSNPTLADGLIYAVQNADGDTTLKRFRSGPDRLEPDSTNPVHKAIMLGGEAITIIGRATQVIQMI